VSADPPPEPQSPAPGPAPAPLPSRGGDALVPRSPAALRQRLRGLSLADVVAGIVITASAALGAAGLVWAGRHAVAVQRLTRGVGDTTFYGADGRPWFPLVEQRHDVPLGQIAPSLRNAVVAVEDHRFRRHPGLDPIAFARATWHNLRTGSVQGGSTLSQQLARTLFLSTRRSYARKLKEAALAVLLEEVLTKDQILEMYLNRVYLSGGVYGVDAMSRSLFAKPSRDLGVAESALVAGLIRAPSALSPWSNWEGARERSQVVLARMREEGYITAAAERQARGATLSVTAHPRALDARGGYAKDYLRAQFRERVGDDHPADWQVHTTFLPAVQAAAETAVSRGLARLDRPGLQAALVALDPRTGDLLALVGGDDFTRSPFNRAVRSRRQPGSAFKPFVYAAGLAEGLSPVTVLHDLRDVTITANEQEWTPTNSGGETPDDQTLREALFTSNNQAAVALQQRVGSGSVLRLARSLGLRELPDVPSLALGTGLVTPLELTAAFAAFPNGGFAVEPRAITDALDGDGEVAFTIPPVTRRVLSDAAAFQTLTMLRDVIDRGTGSSARSLGVRLPAGGKTGTTDDFKDAWFVGFTSAVVVGVWVGFDQPATIDDDGYGARIALPIWADFVRRTERLLPARDFEPPVDLDEMELCRVTFLRPVAECPTYVEYFKDGDQRPTARCDLHSGSFEDRAGRAVDRFFGRLGRRLKRIFD
jgi:1A family penicillin-binding protein